MHKFFIKFCTYFAGTLTFLFGLKATMALAVPTQIVLLVVPFAGLACATIAWTEFKHDAKDEPRSAKLPGEAASLILAIKQALAEARFAERDDESIAVEANRIVRRGLDKSCIKYKEYKTWRRKNPSIFTAVVDSSNRLVGFFDVFPLSEHAVRGLLDGTSHEHALTINEILPADQNASAKYLYIATIMTNPRQKSFSPLVANEVLLIKFSEFLSSEFPPNGVRQIVAFAHSRFGERLLKNAKFRNIALSSDSKQHDPLYELGPEGYENLVNTFRGGLQGRTRRISRT